ncbi:hypothetical protein BJX70DRAFT_395580 [Aspergillus crustosus]
MPLYSKFVVTTLAFFSIAGVTTAAPALGMGLGRPISNETMSVLTTPGQSGGAQDGATDPNNSTEDLLLMNDVAMCGKDDDACLQDKECCSEKCRREYLIFGRLRCVKRKEK